MSRVMRGEETSPVMGLWGQKNLDAGDRQAPVVVENPVVVVGRRGCCMVHVVKRLLTVHGVNPTVYEVENDGEEAAVIEDLRGHRRVGPGDGNDGGMALPVVIIGGELVGGVERVIQVHISGELDAKLKAAGALWL